MKPMLFLAVLLLASPPSPSNAQSDSESKSVIIHEPVTVKATNKFFKNKSGETIDLHDQERESLGVGRDKPLNADKFKPDTNEQNKIGKNVSDSAEDIFTKIVDPSINQGASTVEDQVKNGQYEIQRKIAETQLSQIQKQAMEEHARTGAITPQTALKTGEAYVALGQPKEAERMYKAALRSEPRSVDALSGLAVVQAQQGRKDEAVATAQRALTLDPSNKMARLVAGHAEELSKGASATRLLNPDAFGPSAKDAGPGPAGPRPAGPGRALTGAGLYSPAVRPTPSQDMVLRALGLAAAGQEKAALLLLAQAIDADPKNAGAYIVRSELGNSLGNFTGAMADAGKALELSGGDPALDARALRARAFAKLETGDAAGALADLDRAVALEPMNALAHLYRGMALEKLGRSSEAAAAARRALELDPGLAPLVEPLSARLSSRQPSPFSSRMRSGGLLALALLLLFLGIAGTSKRRKEATTSGAPSGHTPKPAGVELRAGDFLGGTYRIVREIGRGGMGVVYEAQDETLQRRVAIKRMQGADSGDLQRFLREARLVAQLKHPHLAEIYNVVVAGEPFLVFEFVDGRGLDAVLRAGSMPAAQAKKVVGEICAALQYAHGRNIIHRDLKPSNIMVTADGAVKVMDFGIAHQARGASTMTQTAVCGTPAYMAPEQGFGTVSKASDLYALGVMCYELLTGVRPFEQADFAEAKMSARFRPATQLIPALPRGVDAFFARALTADPSKRFASAEEFHLAFDRALDGTPAPIS